MTCKCVDWWALGVDSQWRDEAQVTEYNEWSNFIYTRLERELRADSHSYFPDGF